MNQTTQTSENRNRLQTLVQQTPVVAGALLAGAGVATPGIAGADLIITNLDQVLDDTPGSSVSFHFDLDGDENDDFEVYINSLGDTASVNGVFGKTDFVSNVVGADPYAVMLSEGGQVDASFFDGTLGTRDTHGLLFNAEGGPWASVGAYGFVGLMIEDQFSSDIWYGWLEITRGSVILGRTGFQTTVGGAAPIPNAPQGVPAPGTLALLASGAVGLLGLRRRRSAKTAG